MHLPRCQRTSILYNIIEIFFIIFQIYIKNLFAGVTGFEPIPLVLETNMLPLTPNSYLSRLQDSNLCSAVSATARKATSVNLSYLLVLRKRVYYKTFKYKLSRQSNLFILSISVGRPRFELGLPVYQTSSLKPFS